MADRDPQPASSAPLATNRPWLAVAGCLGGGTLAIGAAMLLLVAAVVLLVLVPDILSPSRRHTAMFISALGELTEAPALKVATREIAVRVDASTPTEATLRAWLVPIGPGWKVEVGRTKVELVAEGNRVQYIVPLEVDGARVEAGVEGDFGDSDVELVVTLPPPRVDESLVEVQSDPKRLRIEIDRDWADHVVGDDRARDEALAAIREAVIREASSEIAMFEVREKARATVVEMLRALLPEELRDRPIRIRWSDEPR
ncbi:MAG: DUF4230 domain-containing protein [Planctomycetaceae bacterium]|nr:DUF4230 domain-containing protein [Planctomycetaceae bacterium]